MIAAAMTTRIPRQPLYADLAKSGAVIQRDLPPSSMPRLQESVEAVDVVQVELTFSFDNESRLQVVGKACTKVHMACHLCSQPQPLQVEAAVEGKLATSEAQAEFWRHNSPNDEMPIVVVSSAELDEVELVEDELLLVLPSRVCVEEQCKNRPALSYGPMSQESDGDTYRPFAQLAELATQLETSSDDTSNLGAPSDESES